MKRVYNQLAAKEVDTLTEPGLYLDGGGLYFQITGKGSRSWIYRYSLHGKTRDMGLGSFPSVGLKRARDLADAARVLVADGIDPIDSRKQGRQLAAAALTVEQAGKAWVKAQRPRWKTEKHARHVARRLEQHVYSRIGHLPISDIRSAEVQLALAPIWTVTHELATRIRIDLYEIIEWAIHNGHRQDQSNPAERRRLKHSLPIGIREVKHFASLPYTEAPAFLAKLRGQDDPAARVLEFILLTGCRVSDVCGAHKAHSVPLLWSHVDLDRRVWNLPDTKSGKPHTTPLSEPAIALLKELQRSRNRSDIAFPSARGNGPIRDTTLRRLLKDLGYSGRMTTHGARSMLRTWASEVASFPTDIVEMTLAHSQSKLTAAYQRGDLLAKRARLMTEWADFVCDTAPSALIALRA